MNSSTGVLTIDLAAVQNNWRFIRSRLQPGSQTGAVIKANAYGLGAERVGPALYAVGCREFFLATLEEALAARRYLPGDAVIYVLGGVRKQSEALCIAARLVPVLFSLDDIERWGQACISAGASRPCAIKVDTGMTRLGLSEDDLALLCREPKRLSSCPPMLFMSHLACADEPEHPLNTLQLEAFKAAAATFKALFPEARLSLANSSGTFLGKEWHFDLVRPGAALYGVNPHPVMANPMESVLHLQLPVLQIRTLKATATIGYGATATCSPPVSLAVVAGGYADGLHRTIGRDGEGVLFGAKVPIVGRISMDTTIFDVTALKPLPESTDGLYVEVLNQQLTVDHLAKRTGALGYDVLTSVGHRYRRDYRVSELNE